MIVKCKVIRHSDIEEFNLILQKTIDEYRAERLRVELSDIATMESNNSQSVCSNEMFSQITVTGHK